MAYRRPLLLHPYGLEQLPATDRVQLNFLNLGAKGPNLTPTANAITVTTGRHSLFTTAATAALRTLTTINGGLDGDVIVIQGIAAGSSTVPIKDNDGNLKLAGDFSVDQLYDTLMLMKDGTIWIELMRSNNGT